LLPADTTTPRSRSDLRSSLDPLVRKRPPCWDRWYRLLRASSEFRQAQRVPLLDLELRPAPRRGEEARVAQLPRLNAGEVGEVRGASLTPKIAEVV
jgi:hypothetical protein